MMISTIRLLLLVSLTCAIASTVSAEVPAFCRDLDCPKYKVLEQTDQYELRSYSKATWVRCCGGLGDHQSW